ncbi:PD-(D/E)XK nuclease family protein [Desulfovibrio sp. JY]|nr:PD-(D/E)XK nuclease family protein [Desulfovibrio sp. JY]
MTPSGGTLPSVTRILSPWADFSRVPDDVLAHAAERGTLVHRACACRLTGVWSPPVSPEVAGYVLSFEQWAPIVTDVILCEEELVDEAAGYQGHPDLICRLQGDNFLSVIDFKTPLARAKAWRPQLAAYQALARKRGLDVRRLMSVRLKKSAGRPIVNESTATAAHDLAVFRNALACWQYFNGGN